MVLQVVVVAGAWVRKAPGTTVLLADGILVHRGIGLGCAVVRRGDAITGFTAIVTVSVVYSAVWVFIYTEAHGKQKKISFQCFLHKVQQYNKKLKSSRFYIKTKKGERNIMKMIITITSCGREIRGSNRQ